MVRPGQVVLAGIQERGQVLGVDLWQVPLAGLSPQYVRARTWSGLELKSLPADRQQAARPLCEPRKPTKRVQLVI